MDLAERNRLIAVTKGFQNLQGLLCVPVGLVNVAFACVHIDQESSLGRLGALLAVIPCAFAATFAAAWYYRRRFGVVRRRGALSVLLLTAGGIVGVIAMMGAMYVDGSLYKQPVASYPISLTCLWWAAAYLSFYLMPYGIRPHSLWFAALFLALGFLTMMGVVPKSQFFLGSGHAGNVFIWIAFCVHGLLDHMTLLRLLPKAPLQQAGAPSGQRHD
jgi:hypothetical protein